MLIAEQDDLHAYREKLRRYTLDELEDIYFQIHILRHPQRYRLVLQELEARGLRLCAAPPISPGVDLPALLNRHGLFEKHPLVRAAALSALLYLMVLGATFALLIPIWFFAIPLRFVGLESALVYLFYAPVPAYLGISAGLRAGGRGSYLIFALLGVVTAFLLLNATGAPAAILRPLLEPRYSTGGYFGGF